VSPRPPHEPNPSNADPRRHAPAAARNREPLLNVLRRILPDRGRVLEVASGSGEHVVHFARALPGLTFQPSDPDPDARRSVDAWRTHEDLANVLPVVALDAAAPAWPVEPEWDAVLCANMIHIAPWEAALGLLRGTGSILAPGQPLVLYGPFLRADRPTAPSNEAFDENLRSRNPEWGIRRLERVVEAAAACRLALEEVVEMPANNATVIFRRVDEGSAGLGH